MSNSVACVKQIMEYMIKPICGLCNSGSFGAEIAMFLEGKPSNIYQCKTFPVVKFLSITGSVQCIIYNEKYMNFVIKYCFLVLELASLCVIF
jgi:hypothetical protein